MAQLPMMGDLSTELARRQRTARFLRVRATLCAEAERAAAGRFVAVAENLKEPLVSSEP